MIRLLITAFDADSVASLEAPAGVAERLVDRFGAGGGAATAALAALFDAVNCQGRCARDGCNRPVFGPAHKLYCSRSCQAAVARERLREGS